MAQYISKSGLDFCCEVDTKLYPFLESITTFFNLAVYHKTNKEMFSTKLFIHTLEENLFWHR